MAVSSSLSRTRIVLADDHPVYRTGLARAIAQRVDLEVVAEVGDGRAALEAIAAWQPDVAVLDIRMPGLDGLEVVTALRAREVGTRVLFLSGSENAESLYAALAVGASGYLLKTSEPAQVCDAIAAVARGEVLFAPELHVALARDIRAREQVGERPFLTEREREILHLTAGGGSATEIAAGLHLSVATVRTHLQNCYQKLDVSDRAAAVAKAMRLGIID
jgi:two-component system, NarL family, nitrate/nitrite response regulator NarL